MKYLIVKRRVSSCSGNAWITFSDVRCPCRIACRVTSWRVPTCHTQKNGPGTVHSYYKGASAHIVRRRADRNSDHDPYRFNEIMYTGDPTCDKIHNIVNVSVACQGSSGITSSTFQVYGLFESWVLPACGKLGLNVYRGGARLCSTQNGFSTLQERASGILLQVVVHDHEHGLTHITNGDMDVSNARCVI